MGSEFLFAVDINIFQAVATFSDFTELQSYAIWYKFGVLLMLRLSMLVNLKPLNSPGKLIHLPLNATLEILMLLVQIVLNTFKRWRYVLIFSAVPQNHVNLVLQVLFVILLKHKFWWHRILFCAKGKGKMYVYKCAYTYTLKYICQNSWCIIKSLRTKNTCGCNEVSNYIVKLTAQFIISPSTYICNAVLSTGVFPNRLKYAEVKPIFEKGNKQEIPNYRPISLLTFFSKIIEKLIYVRLHAHIDMNNIVVQEQYGFRIHSSPEQAAFTLINSILTAMNNNQMVGGVFCDLQMHSTVSIMKYYYKS